MVRSCSGILFSLKKEVLTSAWMNLEDLMLSDVASHKRTGSVRSTDVRSLGDPDAQGPKVGGGAGAGGSRGELVFNACRVPVWGR